MKETKTGHIVNIICRWVVGLTFIFSGFVKGVDPLGTAYKIQEYMTAWSVGSLTFEWATPMAPFLSVFLVTLEFVVGVMLITNCYRRLTAWALGLMMLFFFTTTLIDALTNKVTDCGCFGDAIHLTNWETFFKNVALMVPTIIIFVQRRKKWNHKLRLERETLVAICFIAAMVIFACWNINNEPCIDFRAWKVGNQMMPFGENIEKKSYLTYKNKTTGETIEFESKKLMDYYADSTWKDNWEFVDSRVEDPYEIKADGFSMLGPDGEDNAKEIIASEEPVLIATIHHIDDVDKKGVAALKRIHNYCIEQNINLVLLSSVEGDLEQFLHVNDLSMMNYFLTDTKAIETMLRSNPGFILIHNAKVIDKWHYKNYEKILQFDFAKLMNSNNEEASQE